MSLRVPCYILAGGRSSRFGADKARAIFQGRPLIEHVAGLLAPVASSVTVVADRAQRYEDLGFRTLADRHPGFGPLAGLESALHDLPDEQPWLLLCPCDALVIRRPWLERLLAARPAPQADRTSGESDARADDAGPDAAASDGARVADADRLDQTGSPSESISSTGEAAVPPGEGEAARGLDPPHAVAFADRPHWQPMPALYARWSLPIVARRLRSDDRSMQGLLDELTTIRLPRPADWPERWQANRPQDL